MLTLLMLASAIDYRQPDTWVCRPGRDDACSAEVAAPRVEPKADCFYVYPTTSMDAGANSDMTPGIEERGTVAAQFAPFGSVCRRFAPLYRQVTLPGLRSLFGKTPMPIDRETPYADVLAAWRDYLAHDNGGRPFVLIGHSQGANALRRLVAEEIDGKPVQARMLSAILAGAAVEVPAGKDVGGSFKSVPLCRSATQTACVVTWATYRDTAPAKTLFGRTATPGMEVGCTNPAARGRACQPSSCPRFGSVRRMPQRRRRDLSVGPGRARRRAHRPGRDRRRCLPRMGLARRRYRGRPGRPRAAGRHPVGGVARA